MKKIVQAAFVPVCLAILLGLTSCTYTYMSYIIHLDNGESVKITLETTNGYKLALSDGIVTIKEGHQEISQGGFVTNFDYSTFLESVEILEVDSEDSPSVYIFQFTDDTGLVYGFVEQIDNSNISLHMLMSTPSLEDTQELVRRLQLEKVD